MILVFLISFLGVLFAVLPLGVLSLSVKNSVLDSLQSGNPPLPPTHGGEATQEVVADGPTRFVFSSHFLLQCWRFLVERPEEQIIPISGMEMPGGSRMASTFLKVEYSSSTLGGVSGNPRSTHASLREMDAFGHQLVAVFHSHPGCGVEGVSPSAIDHAAQERYQSLGYESISGIYSRDGYIRFFAEEGLDFEVEIQGLGVLEVQENVFKLDITRERNLPVQDTEAA